MKKILIIAAGVLCSAAIYVGVNSYSNNSQSDLMTRNLEALTQGENPENGTCCSLDNNTCKLALVTVHNAYYLSDGRCN